MKTLHFFSHPLMQLFSFGIILVGNSNFGGPFGYFVFFASLQGYGYAIAGMIGIGLTILSTIFRGMRSINIQAAGLVFMCVSFIWFVVGNTHREDMKEVLPFITLLLFISVCASVGTKFVELHRRV